jgi:hypothetical protein
MFIVFQQLTKVLVGTVKQSCTKTIAGLHIFSPLVLRLKMHLSIQTLAQQPGLMGVVLLLLEKTWSLE